MAIRTSEQLLQWLEKEKQKRLQQQKKIQQRKKQIKAQEQQRKLQHRKHIAKLEKQAQKALKPQKQTLSRTIIIYKTKYIERFDDDNLYETRQELENAFPNNINWNKWQELVDLTKQQLQTKKK